MENSGSDIARAAALYETMAQKLAVIRRRLGQPLTAADKILLGHLDDPHGQALVRGESYLQLRPDRVVFQDVLGQTGMLQFMQTRRARIAVPASIHCDHLIQARVGAGADLRDSLRENREIYDFLRSAAARFGADFWEPGAGIVHQVVLENYAFPGAIIIGTDSHTPNAGGLGACAVGVGGADAVEVLAGLPWELLYPRRIAVYLTGALQGWTAPKDVIVWVAGELGVSGGTNAIVEYIGPGARSLSATGKATIANMGAELGATTSLFAADVSMVSYLESAGRGDWSDLLETYRDLLRPDDAVESDPERYYDRVLRLDLSRLEPQISGPHSPDRVRPISRFAAELAADGELCEEISAALIGSCTNSSYGDMSRAADVARQAAKLGLGIRAPLFVTPGSERVRATIERDGQCEALNAVGATVLANACGPCIGQWRRGAGTTKNAIVTSYNRNFPGRNDCQPSTQNFIASPEIVVALALAGRLSFNPLADALTAADGTTVRLEPPPPPPDVPPAGLALGRPLCITPPADGASISLAIDPGSERLQAMAPWPAWDGRDFRAMPILFKARGKTTTDQISPAGPWLKFRGHLDRFSENLLLGGINAYTGERGLTRNVLTGEAAQPVAAVARHYRSQGLRWVIVGDHNYGEGSSREHAALSPRLLGAGAVIARSFARIHETNLKKQGLLALTFERPEDYDRLRETDRIELLELAAMAPGSSVRALVRHEDGTATALSLRHTYSAAQLEWFRAGSALNVIGP
ncbi:MAG: aconitate hydratase [Betaproteobacteria bacterium]|nr:MAG: aconitate hydratase [Betaproteobacteria bacterium]